MDRLEPQALQPTDSPLAARGSAPLPADTGWPLTPGPERGGESVRLDDLDALREQRGMTWIEHEHGWIAEPAEVLAALTSDGFQECKREMTTSRRDGRPAGGVWQGIDPRTGAVASVVWVARPTARTAIVFIEIDGEPIVRSGPDPDEEEGGEG